MLNRILILVLILVLEFISVTAQDLMNDMPRQTISVNSVPKSWFQIETGLGIKINKKSFEKITRYALPSLLLRFGLTNKVEARFITGIAYSRYHFFTPNQDSKGNTWGSGPIEIGGKIKLLKEKKKFPSVSFTAHYRINKNLRLSSDSINGGNFRISFQNRLSDNFQLDYSTGINWISWPSPERYIYTVSPVWHINEKWRGYIEASGIIWSDISPLHFIRVGGGYHHFQQYSIDLICGKAWNKKESYRLETFPSGEIFLQFTWRIKSTSNDNYYLKNF